MNALDVLENGLMLLPPHWEPPMAQIPRPINVISVPTLSFRTCIISHCKCSITVVIYKNVNWPYPTLKGKVGLSYLDQILLVIFSSKHSDTVADKIFTMFCTLAKIYLDLRKWNYWNSGNIILQSGVCYYTDIATSFHVYI